MQPENDRTPARDTDQPPLRFEEALTRLEQIVERLERGQLGLDDALLEYEQGIRLIRHCRRLLQQAEQKIEMLTGIDEKGHPITEPFVEEELSLEEKRERRSQRRGARTSNLEDTGPRNSPSEGVANPEDFASP